MNKLKLDADSADSIVREIISAINQVQCKTGSTTMTFKALFDAWQLKTMEFLSPERPELRTLKRGWPYCG